MRVSVFGLGKLGTCLAALFASKGFPTIGVDVDPRVVRAINEGRSPISEPGVDGLLKGVGSFLRATDDSQEAVFHSDISFIMVPTPSTPRNCFSLRYVKEAGRMIGRALKDKKDYHLIVLSSTVLPGSTEHGLMPVVSSASGKVCGADFGICYSPEFVALGNVLEGLLNPSVILIGESDPHAGDVLSDFFSQVCGDGPYTARMNFVNAELAKLALNTYLTTKITFANMVSMMCEKLPGADVDTVTSVVGKDPRIGGRYMKGGLGYGGPCFPRDNLALSYLADVIGCDASLALTTDRMNRNVVDHATNRIMGMAIDKSVVAVLGLAYKENTDVTEESQGFEIARRLSARGIKVLAYDGMALKKSSGVRGENFRLSGSISECVSEADMIVIANPAPEFKVQLDLHLPRRERPLVIFDCWRILDRRRLGENVTYIGLGLGDDGDLPRERLRVLWNADSAE